MTSTDPESRTSKGPTMPTEKIAKITQGKRKSGRVWKESKKKNE